MGEKVHRECIIFSSAQILQEIKNIIIASLPATFNIMEYDNNLHCVKINGKGIINRNL